MFENELNPVLEGVRYLRDLLETGEEPENKAALSSRLGEIEHAVDELTTAIPWDISVEDDGDPDPDTDDVEFYYGDTEDGDGGRDELDMDIESYRVLIDEARLLIAEVRRKYLPTASISGYHPISTAAPKRARLTPEQKKRKRRREKFWAGVAVILFLPIWPFYWAFETLFGSSKRK